MNSRLGLWFTILLCSTIPISAANSLIQRVQVSPQTFMPSLGEVVVITADLQAEGSVVAQVLDRDGYLVSTLMAGEKVGKGPLSLTWDGRDDLGSIVPNESFSFRLELRTSAETEEYFPAAIPQEHRQIEALSYDRWQGLVRYELPFPGRVHLQAGIATIVEGKPRGPVMKTLVNREPRPGGAVLEHWMGYDESGKIRVSDLDHFVIGGIYTPLPENAVITRGNRDRSFIGELPRRSGRSLIPAVHGHQHHHQGLEATSDHSPDLAIRPLGAVWSKAMAAWLVEGRKVVLEVSLVGPTRESFLTPESLLHVFEDGEPVKVVAATTDPFSVTVEIEGGPSRPSVVTVNWASGRGPVAVNSISTARVMPAGGRGK